MKGVKVEDYFSDRELFSNSAQLQMSSEGRGGFMEQEVDRLKKIVQKISLIMKMMMMDKILHLECRSVLRQFNISTLNINGARDTVVSAVQADET